MKKIITALVITDLIFSSATCFATKPCPTPKCYNENLNFNLEECRKIADWIAVGNITDVENSEQGYPLNKNFASFTLQVSRWEKGGGEKIAQIKFKVGWCDNWQELPTDTSGLFRFYGESISDDGQNDSNHYYYFQKID
jgi:hypothetical protein